MARDPWLHKKKEKTHRTWTGWPQTVQRLLDLGDKKKKPVALDSQKRSTASWQKKTVDVGQSFIMHHCNCHSLQST